MSFTLDLKAAAAKFNSRADAFVRAVVMEVDRSLVEKSPVGNADLWANPANKPKGYVGGRFRANWQYGEGRAPEGELYEGGGPFPSPQECMERETSKIKIEAAGKVHYLVNNLPYAQAIEDGHSSKQAPAGVVGITVIEFQAIVAETVAKTK
jgi:hypothetical protein